MKVRPPAAALIVVLPVLAVGTAVVVAIRIVSPIVDRVLGGRQ